MRISFLFQYQYNTINIYLLLFKIKRIVIYTFDLDKYIKFRNVE